MQQLLREEQEELNRKFKELMTKSRADQDYAELLKEAQLSIKRIELAAKEIMDPDEASCTLQKILMFKEQLRKLKGQPQKKAELSDRDSESTNSGKTTESQKEANRKLKEATVQMYQNELILQETEQTLYENTEKLDRNIERTRLIREKLNKTKQLLKQFKDNIVHERKVLFGVCLALLAVGLAYWYFR